MLVLRHCIILCLFVMVCYVSITPLHHPPLVCHDMFSVCLLHYCYVGDSPKRGRILFFADSATVTTNKKVSKPSKSKANHVMNHETLHEGPVAEEHSPMEIDCKEVTSNDMNHELRKEPLSTNDTHVQDSLNILQEFVREKLHRTVLSLADFKRLLLLRQTGE